MCTWVYEILELRPLQLKGAFLRQTSGMQSEQPWTWRTKQDALRAGDEKPSLQSATECHSSVKGAKRSDSIERGSLPVSLPGVGIQPPDFHWWIPPCSSLSCVSPKY